MNNFELDSFVRVMNASKHYEDVLTESMANLTEVVEVCKVAMRYDDVSMKYTKELESSMANLRMALSETSELNAALKQEYDIIVSMRY